MKIDDVKRIAVIGAGNMGHQIGTLCAMHGYDTTVTDASGEQLDKASAFVESYLPGRVAKGRISQAQADDAAGRIHFEPDMAKAVAQADVVIEAVFEDKALKLALFRELDGLTKPAAIFGTNSSAIPSSELAVALKDPSRICNMHFFNPALVMKCVEVMRGPHTSDETFETICELCVRLGKEPGRLNKELFGMVGSQISSCILEKATEILEGGYATAEDIDIICRGALGHPMGPFELVDLTGIDMAYIGGMDRYHRTGKKADVPYPIIVEKYVKGEWGQKTGKGFYTYPREKRK